jgi:3D (Asp-Asp-Asp) domain-containing protein
MAAKQLFREEKPPRASRPALAAVAAALAAVALTALLIFRESEGDMTIPVLSSPARVVVVCDGENTPFVAHDQTVAEALASLGLALGEDDETTLPLGRLLLDGDRVEVVRVIYREEKRTETVAWREVSKHSPLLPEGQTRLMDDGQTRNGEVERVYRRRFENGVFASESMGREKIIRYPWDAVTLVGDPNAVMSTVDGAQFTDIKLVNGIPERYERVLKAQPCTAYSYNPGVYGGSGLYLFQGFVAVDPEKIPIGSLLYIVSPNGKFVYGWAIAADVGQAMVDGRVTIDCFFETYDESVLFGRRTMDIYVVAQLHQSDLEQFVAKEGMFRLRVPE